MTGRDDADPGPAPSVHDRRSHSATIARLASQRRHDDVAIDRGAARRLTVARLRSGVML